MNPLINKIDFQHRVIDHNNCVITSQISRFNYLYRTYLDKQNNTKLSNLIGDPLEDNGIARVRSNIIKSLTISSNTNDIMQNNIIIDKQNSNIKRCKIFISDLKQNINDIDNLITTSIYINSIKQNISKNINNINES